MTSIASYDYLGFRDLRVEFGDFGADLFVEDPLLQNT
jgi:hypothetical protein